MLSFFETSLLLLRSLRYSKDLYCREIFLIYKGGVPDNKDVSKRLGSYDIYLDPFPIEGLSKLKTLEYRLYRKLREKLKNFIGQKETKGKKVIKPWKIFYDKFMNESKDLCEGFNLPMPLEYYYLVAKKAFEFVDKYNQHSGIVHERYITFLSLLMHRIANGSELVPEHFTDVIISEVLPIKWTEYYEMVKSKPDSLKLIEKVSADNSGSLEKATIKKRVYVLVPIGIPGMGKTHSVQALRKLVDSKGYLMSVVSSDEVRKECMNKVARNFPKLSEDKLFEKSGKPAREEFNRRLSDLISSSDKRSANVHFIYIDKNHPPNAVPGTIDLIKAASNPNFDLEIIAVTPSPAGPLFKYKDNSGKEHEYPFSVDFFFNCLDRVQNRKTHETLPGSGTKSLGVLIMFLHMFRSVKLDKESVLKNGFHKHLVLPFVSENTPSLINEELLNSLIAVLRVTKPGTTCEDQKLIDNLHNTYQKSQLQFENPESTIDEDLINKFFEEELLPEVQKINGNENKNGQAVIGAQAEEHKAQEKEVSAPSKLYNPRNLPLYLGLFAEKQSEQMVKDYVKGGLETLAKMYPKDKLLLETSAEVRENSSAGLQFLDNFHVTTLFVGGNKSKRTQEEFKSFQVGHRMTVELVGFVFVPRKLAVAIVYPDQSTIKIENKFPHVSLMKEEWAPKDSNEVMQYLFGENGPLYKDYQKEKLAKMSEFTHKEEVQTSRGKATAYMIKTAANLKVEMVAMEGSHHT